MIDNISGIEGLKILSHTEAYQNYGFNKLFTAFAIIIFVLVIISFIKTEDVVICGVFFVIMLICFALGAYLPPVEYSEKIKVTPIKDKYYIDVTQWKAVNIDGEIITLQRINNKDTAQ